MVFLSGLCPCAAGSFSSVLYSIISPGQTSGLCGSPVSCCSWMQDLAHHFVSSLLLMDLVTSLALVILVVPSSRLIFLHGSAQFLLLDGPGKLYELFGDRLPHTHLVHSWLCTPVCCWSGCWLRRMFDVGISATILVK